MAGSLKVDICAPSRKPIALDASEVIVPGAAGIFAVLPSHTPLLSTLTGGALIVYTPKNSAEFFAVHGGFAEVGPDRVSILADLVERSSEIDPARAQESLDRALERLRKPADAIDIQRAEQSLARALARLQVAGKKEY